MSLLAIAAGIIFLKPSLLFAGDGSFPDVVSCIEEFLGQLPWGGGGN
jgi:hypothetical protein